MQNPLSTTIIKGTADELASITKSAILFAPPNPVTESSDIPKQDVLEKNLEKNKVQIFEETQKTSIGFEQMKNGPHDAKTAAYTKQNDETLIKKRTLPEHAKKLFEANSTAFAAFAKQKENETLAKIENNVDVKLWDRALLLEEYPEGRIPVEIEAKKEESNISIPKKPWKPAGDILPTRVVADMPKNPQAAKKEFVAVEIPKKNEPEQIHLPRYIPKKPVSSPSFPDGNNMTKPTGATKENEIPKMPVFEKPIEIKTIEPTVKTSGVIAGIPKKPIPVVSPIFPAQTQNPEIIVPQKSPSPDKRLKDHPLSASQPEMGDALKTKIIEGQLRGVFENAPEGMKANMEKIPAKELFLVGGFENDSNRIWKSRLREYIAKLKFQGKTVFEDTSITDPKEGETVLDYIKRIYPAIVRAEVNNENS